MAAWRDIAENGAVRGLALLSNVVVLFATARVLGPDDRGRLVSIVTWTMLLAVVAGFSLGQVSHRQIQSDDRQDWLEELAGTLAATAAVGALLVVVATWLLFGRSALAIAGSPAALVLAALMLPFLVLDEYARNLLAANGQIRQYSIAQLAGGGFRLVSVAWVLVVSPSVIAVLACLLASQALVAGLEFLMLSQASTGGFRFARRRLATLLWDALRLHPNTIASFLLVQANVLLLTRMAPSAEVAQYQLAQQLALAPILLPQAGAMVLFGSVARLGPDGAWPETRRLTFQMLTIMGTVALVGAFVGPEVVRAIAGTDFEQAGSLLGWLLVASLGASLSEMLAPQWFGRGYFLLSTALTIVNAIASIMLGAWLIERHGAVGAAWGTAASFSVLVVTAQLAFAAWCERGHRRAIRTGRHDR
jgi:O-antigen/teichoic acid export membrane protein